MRYSEVLEADRIELRVEFDCVRARRLLLELLEQRVAQCFCGGGRVLGHHHKVAPELCRLRWRRSDAKVVHLHARSIGVAVVVGFDREPTVEVDSLGRL